MAICSALVLAAGACQQTPGPQAGPMSSTSRSVEVALESGCLPYLVEGGSIHDRLKGHSARGGKINGKPASRLYGNGDVQIQESAEGGCYMIATGAFRNSRAADAAELRQTVLNLVPKIAGPMTTRFDSGPGFNDPVGLQRQESYCFDLRGKPAWIVLTTSNDPERDIAMQVSVGIDREGLCGKAGDAAKAA